MASDIWLRTILIVRKETCCRRIGYSFRLATRVVLYAPSQRKDSTYYDLCYASRGALAGSRNSSMGPPHEGSIQRPIVPRANALTTELSLASFIEKCVRGVVNWTLFVLVKMCTFQISQFTHDVTVLQRSKRYGTRSLLVTARHPLETTQSSVQNDVFNT